MEGVGPACRLGWIPAPRQRQILKPLVEAALEEEVVEGRHGAARQLGWIPAPSQRQILKPSPSVLVQDLRLQTPLPRGIAKSIQPERQLCNTQLRSACMCLGKLGAEQVPEGQTVPRVSWAGSQRRARGGSRSRAAT